MRDFSVGGVLRRAAALFRAAPWLLLALALLFVVLPRGLATVALTTLKPASPGLSVLFAVIDWLGSLLLQAATVRLALDAANGRPLRFAIAAGTAARSFLPLLAISILFTIVMALACVLLFFPGIMVLCRFFVANAVEVAEDSGILGAFGRSAALTNGVRWRVLGIALVMTVINILAAMIPAFLGGVAGGFFHTPWPTLAGTALGIGLSMLGGALSYAATYLELREIREGLSSEALVSVFG